MGIEQNLTASLRSTGASIATHHFYWKMGSSSGLAVEDPEIVEIALDTTFEVMK